ncbi:TPA: hypothetical protein L9M48_004895 [Klebsiella pneumoniae]|nr:hypothetical protein [Klebsiella pneumoniae]HCI5233915.1 hypothetical protein [Klebsiella pneumoniae]
MSCIKRLSDALVCLLSLGLLAGAFGSGFCLLSRCELLLKLCEAIAQGLGFFTKE